MKERLIRVARCVASEGQIVGRRTLRCSGARWSSTSTRKYTTPLAKTLTEAITTTGPISVAAYMRQCLTFPDTGYYTSNAEGRDQFGQKGDFVTSPEISQVFGELIGLWVVAEWIAQGRKSNNVHLMEMGPGRGTLMDDMLRTIRNFKPLASAIEAVYMVEASPSLRNAQHKLLCGDNPLEDIDIGYRSKSKYTSDLDIIWCEDIRFVPKDATHSPFIIAHEFFDALPIHVFESVKAAEPPATPSQILTPTGTHNLNESATRSSNSRQLGAQWRELVVSPSSPYATHTSLKTPKAQQNQPVPEFQLTRAKAATPHSLYLPETSSRYKALKSTSDAVIEISPESQSYAADFAVRIGGGESPSSLYAASPDPSFSTTTTTASTSPAGGRERPVSPRRTTEKIIKDAASGAALILDYGPAATIPANSLRGIKQHRIVSPFSEPGTVDISADVDFLALAESALEASLGVEVHGPVDQARFLTAMGIEQRAAQLVKVAVDRERGGVGGEKKGGAVENEKERKKEELTETVKRIEGGWKRLVDRGPQGMGKLYQVLAIVPHVPPKEGQPRRRPVGFGGDIAF